MSATFPSVSHRFRVALLLLAGLTLLVRSATAEEWRLIYAVTQEKQVEDPSHHTPPKHETQAYTLTVTLGKEYLVVEDHRQRTIYDFRRQRILVIKLDAHTYDDWSLYSDIGGRVSELQNRLAISAALRAAKVANTETMFNRFGSETDLHIELPPMGSPEPETVIAPTKLEGAGWGFRHQGQPVVQFLPASTHVPEAYYRRFANFLAYQCCIHPGIRRQILAAGHIPEKMVVNWRQLNAQITASYQLRSAETVETDSSILPDHVRPAEHADDPFFRLLASLPEKMRPGHRSTRDDAAQFAAQAVKDKQPLDALLALTEYYLQSGEPMTDEIRQYRLAFDRDEPCRRYFASLASSSKAACQRSLAVCESIDRHDLKKAYMLDLHEADLLMMLGQTRTAEARFLTVLAANPFLAGAYHDLGQLYYANYEHPKAWLCFDTARRLYPEHPLLQEITALEERFQRDFPDFF